MAQMVDIGDKPEVARCATARGRLRLRPATAAAIASGEVPKGDPFATSRVAAIQAVKATPAILPLCHPLPLSQVDVLLDPRPAGYDIAARVRTTARTGVEMEALTAVATAALTVYDMVKAVDKRMIIGAIHLVEKTGGRSGTFRAAAAGTSAVNRRRSSGGG